MGQIEAKYIKKWPRCLQEYMTSIFWWSIRTRFGFNFKAAQRTFEYFRMIIRTRRPIRMSENSSFSGHSTPLGGIRHARRDADDDAAADDGTRFSRFRAAPAPLPSRALLDGSRRLPCSAIPSEEDTTLRFRRSTLIPPPHYRHAVLPCALLLLGLFQ